jgi:hypothetical protein
MKHEYDGDTSWPWCEYECGTMRAAYCTDPFPDTGLMSERTLICRHAGALRDAGGISTARARKIFDQVAAKWAAA